MAGGDICVFDNVHIVIAGRRAVLCSLAGRAVWIPRGELLPESNLPPDGPGKLVIPRWLAAHLELLASRPILIVDDDQEARELMAATLQAVGYGVVRAAEGSQALELLRQGLDAGLILLDLRMPGMDAYGFRAAQMRDPKLAQIPVVLLSGSLRLEEEAAALGIPHFSRKPVHGDALVRLVEQHHLPD